MARPMGIVEKRRGIWGELRDGHVFVVYGRNDDGAAALRRLLAKMNEDDAARLAEKARTNATDVRVKGEVVDDDGEGPNHRGTYSKAYTLLHPDIRWVHRGQGRYLPAVVADELTQSQSHVQT